MRKLLINLFALAFILSAGVFTACSDDDDNNDDRSAVKIDKKHDTALLLCSFGSTYAQPLATYDKIIADYEAAYPNTDIYLSFTSATIVTRVNAKEGNAYAQPDVWVKAIGNAGYKNVYVQSLHIIPGEEYLNLMNRDVKKTLMVSFPDIKVAKSPCLLETEEDVDDVAQILYNYYKTRLNNGEVVVLMGHGNPDSEYTHANTRYDQLEDALQALSGQKNIIVGTVDYGEKMFTQVRDELKAFAAGKGKEYKDITVSLAPLMSIAGDHAQNDLLGGLEDGQTMDDVDPYEPDHEAEYSWKLKLQKLGFTISTDGTNIEDNGFNVIGLGDHKAIRGIWLSHMVEAVKNAESWNEHLGE